MTAIILKDLKENILIWLDDILIQSNTVQRLVMNTDLWTFSNETIWVPDDNSDPQIRMCIIENTIPAGRRGRDAT